MNDDDLRDLETRTQNMLDGIRVNRELYAKGVRSLIAEVRQLRQQVHEASHPSEPASFEVNGSFKDAIDEILGGIGKR